VDRASIPTRSYGVTQILGICRTFHRGIGFSTRIQDQVVNRVKHLVGYPEVTPVALKKIGLGHVLIEMNHYGLGTNRTREEYITLTNINFKEKICNRMTWCNKGELD
jgi:hypothetical protein